MKRLKIILNCLIYSLFIIFSLGHLARISFLGQQVNGYAYEFIMLVIFLLLITRYRFKPIVEAYKINKYLFWFSAFILLTFFLNLNHYSQQENLVSFLYQIRLFFYFIFFFYAKEIFSKKAVYLFIILTAVISLAQYFLYPDLRNLIYLGWDPHIYRIFGAYFDTYVAAVMYGLIFFYLFFQKRNLLNNILLLVYFVFVLVTFSRIGYLSFLVTLALIYLKRDIKKFLLIILFALLILFLIPKPGGEGVNLTRIFSIKSRMVDYQTALKVWEKSPIIGIGYNRIRYFKKDLTSHSGASFHSSFLIVLVTTGLIGLSLFVLSLKNLIEANGYSQYLVYYVAIVSLADNALLHPFILFLLLGLVSLSRK